MWYNNNNTGANKVNQNTHRNLEKGVGVGEAGPGREGSGEESQLRFICQPPHNTENETSKCVVVWKLPLFSPTVNSFHPGTRFPGAFCRKLANASVWSFRLQEPTAKPWPQNRWVQAFSFKEISGSPDLDHRGDRRGRVKKRQLSSLPLHFSQWPLGDSFLKLLDSFWEPILFIRPWSVWSGNDTACLEMCPGFRAGKSPNLDLTHRKHSHLLLNLWILSSTYSVPSILETRVCKQAKQESWIQELCIQAGKVTWWIGSLVWVLKGGQYCVKGNRASAGEPGIFGE